ncbi:C-C motif chemokine 3-like 1 [Sardina pilchardus]|uniref:C-C motif chemokine 3-like 1 n=1 Tax=Sardina pilchardus TaxID=27697 RepID=UPI002E12216A
MAVSRLLLLTTMLLLGAVMITEGLRMASGPKMCCFKFETRPLPQKRVIGYSRTSSQCPKAAVVLQTARRQVCAQPSEAWVQKIIISMDAQNAGEQSPL